MQVGRRIRETRSSAMHSSCQTRALNPDARGQGARPFDILVSGPAGNVLFLALLKKESLKPSLATMSAKASERVIADAPGIGRRVLSLGRSATRTTSST